MTGGNDPVVLVLPAWTIKSPNRTLGRHWSAFKKHRDQVRLCVRAHVRRDQLGQIPPHKAGVEVVYHNAALFDDDNLAGGSKALIDALRYVGLLRDDHRGAARLTFDQVKCPRKRARVVVTITTIVPGVRAPVQTSLEAP